MAMATMAMQKVRLIPSAGRESDRDKKSEELDNVTV